MSERKYPDVSFVDFDADKTVAEMTKEYEALMGTTVRPASPERLFLLWMANIAIQLKANIDITGKENVPRFASWDKLESLTELFHDVSRLPASAATTNIRFYLSQAQASAQLIPAGTRITTEDENVTFLTEENAYVPAGEISVEVSSRCQVVGAIGNGYTPGQIFKLVDVFPWYQKCENTTTSEGGADQESDTELYNRMRESMDTYSTAGPMGGYVYFAKTASPSIADAVANSPTPGVVHVYVLLEHGELPGKEIMDMVLEKVTPDKVRPLTDYVEIKAPEPVSYSIDLTYYIPNDSSMSAAATEAAVAAAVEEYKAWQSARIGRDINPSKLYQLLMATGVKRLEIRAPVFQKVTDGRKVQGVVTPTQVAQLQSESVLNGGYEDE